MKKYSSILFIILLTGCNFNTVYKNREQDKQDAEKVTEKFYSLMNSNNRQKAIKLMSQKLFKITSKEKFNQILDESSKECGNIISDSLIHWETVAVEGTNPKNEYVLIYDVKRDIKNTQEKFTLYKENDSIKILGYDIRF
ncbi:hypothetical protein [Epilithonimonas caeni]|uniref:hypothetical protein n=1 Tax=Epilithonimonas caeni TaxID=365343 RepID=UPI0004819E6B|nr:hypothetical protein [Epilithonimonas caeni]